MRPFLRRLTVNDSFFSVWQRSDPSIGYAWHYHTEYELAFVTQSEGKRFVGDSIESYSSGDLILLAPTLVKLALFGIVLTPVGLALFAHVLRRARIDGSLARPVKDA